MWRRFRRDRAAMAGLILVGAVVAVAAAAPWLAPADPNQLGGPINEAPSGAHLLGTDDVGRDLLSRVIFGARISMRAAFQIVAQALAVALPLGLLAGYLGGIADRVVMRFMDGLFAFPPLILALTVAALLGPNLTNATIAISVVFVPSLVRIVRGQVLAVREETYIEASRAIGVGTGRMLVRHVLPNVAPPVIVQVALSLGYALLAEAGLSFLGFGVQPPTASWGVMLRRSFDFVFSAPWQIFVPGGAIMVAVLGFNLVGDGLRDALGRERVRLRATPADDTPRFEAQRSESEDSEGGSAAALRVRGLTVDLGTPTGWLRVVDGVDLTVDAGEIVALVGESGCGKTVTALSIMGVLPPGASRSGGSVMVQDHELLGLVPRQLRKVQGREIAMVFQEPGSSLNPAFTVGDQIAEVIRHHLEMSRSEATARVVELLDRVGIPDPAARARSYPHELSGGMQQRAMLAMALACGPRVLLADEPTTALDVTVQAQILDLLAELARDEKLGVLLVTHDLGVVAEVADRVAVMYAGQVVETAPADALFTRPRHPYSEALLASRPQSVAPGDPLPVILGDVPRPGAMPPGCRFHPRCPYAIESCGAERPQVIELGPSRTACLRAHDLQLRGLQ